MVRMRGPLRGQTTQPSVHQVGSLRDLAKSTSMVPGHCVAGGAIREAIVAFIHARDGFADRCCKLMGSQSPLSALVSERELDDLRSDIAAVISKRGTPEARHKLSLSHPATIDGGKVLLQGTLIDAWATWSGDPAVIAASWIWTGAPAGVSSDFQLDGILDPVPEEHPDSLDTLECD